MFRRDPDSGKAFSSESESEIQTEKFDLLVVASGYFARPCIPKIPGLEGLADRVFHSSDLNKIDGRLQDEKALLADGNVAVIGGSMSGVEAVSAAALHQSSYLNENPVSQKRKTRKVYHVHSRPFWTLPTYLPHAITEDKVSFLPLDLAMYDLSRRAPGPIDYQLGLVPEEKVAKTGEYFGSLLGDEYAQFGHARGSVDGKTSQPPWVAIGNDYAEFVRSGAVETTMGRVVSVSKTDTLPSIKIDIPGAEPKTLENISAIVMATGYTPFEALSFLPKDILCTLEYSTDDPFLPLVLDKAGTIRSEVPDLGFVGFYRGPYWGAMEMQARFLGSEWAKEDHELDIVDDQRTSVRILRQPDSMSRRSQFPMGDYVGLMESFARDLGIDRMALSNEGRSGPAVPALYPFGQTCSPESSIQESRLTVDGLKQVFANDCGQQVATSMAIFRALHGKWKFTRTNQTIGDQESGILEFSPRYPSNGAAREYLCHEYSPGEEPSSHTSNRPIFRFSDADETAGIHIWPDGLSSSQSAHKLEITSFSRKTVDGKDCPGEYVAHARAVPLNHSSSTGGSNPGTLHRYVFYFKGVSVVSWEFVDPGDSFPEGNGGSVTTDGPHTRTVYER